MLNAKYFLTHDGRKGPQVMEVAEGQRAQVAVLGEEKVMMLAMLKAILEAAKKNPDIVKVPVISVSGAGSGLEGAAAILGGASNISRMISASKGLAPTGKDQATGR